MNLVRRNNTTFPSLWNSFFENDWLSEERDFGKQQFNIPAVNISETDTAYRIELAVPGMKKEHFEIDINNKVLTVSAKRTLKKEEKETQFSRREFNFSAFERAFSMPKDVKEDQVKAAYEEGILTLDIPRVSTAESRRQIKIA